MQTTYKFTGSKKDLKTFFDTIYHVDYMARPTMSHYDGFNPKKDVLIVVGKKIGSCNICGLCNYRYGLMKFCLIQSNLLEEMCIDNKLQFDGFVDDSNQWRGYQKFNEIYTAIRSLPQESAKLEDKIQTIKCDIINYENRISHNDKVYSIITTKTNKTKKL